MLYQTYQAQRDLTAPLAAVSALTARGLGALPGPLAQLAPLRWTSAACQLVTGTRLTHTRPCFGIERVTVGRRSVGIHEEVVERSAFASLVHFAKDVKFDQPRVLVVAALAGHFSTLLRSTVRSLLADHDVYLIDWHNARDVPLTEGPFGLDDYIDHVMRCIRAIGPGSHLLAVCQPCPASVAATALLSEEQDPATPRSVTLIAGPVDCRVNPTSVNLLATEVPVSWFEDRVIATVPLRYAGALRRVYPGFLQLGAFVSMNLGRHVEMMLGLFHDLGCGAEASAAATGDFYREYFAVLDLTAEFYLETVERVFQRHLLARGELIWRGRRVDPGAVTRSGLLTVEGERDDICGVGQTMAAQDLCSGVRPSRRLHHLQPGVGHYGAFAGRAWERQIYPVVRNFILAND